MKPFQVNISSQSALTCDMNAFSDQINCFKISSSSGHDLYKCRNLTALFERSSTTYLERTIPVGTNAPPMYSSQSSKSG